MGIGKIFIGAVLSFFLVGGILVWQATRSTKSLILLPHELSDKKDITIERIRVRGKVADPIDYQLEPEMKLSFQVADPEKPEVTMPVVYRGLRPDMFAAGRDILIDGDYLEGKIEAAKVLTQCPSKYEPKVPGAEG